MRKKQLLMAVGLILVVGIGAFLYLSNPSSGPSSTPTNYAEAKDTPVTAKCLEANTSLTLPDGALEDIEMSAISYLIDVPAGTEVDVKLATYTDTRVTGSDRYPAEYGNYNFVMEKQDSGWVVTDFKRCEE